MGGNKSTNKSQDLAEYTKKYGVFCKKIRNLIEALKTHHQNLARIDASRQDVSKHLAGLTKNTPLFDSVGLIPNADRPSHTVCSLASVHDEVSAKSKSYIQKYQQFVLEYAVEWEKVIRTRVDNGIKKAEALRIDLDHYQKKVESLRLTANQTMAKGKSVPSSTQEKLARNEEKLLSAKQTYNRVATDLCILMEEVTERNWRDLHPLLIKIAQFDMTLSGDESKELAKLSNVLTKLKAVAQDNGLSPQPRLKDLAALKPELLSTRPGGVQSLQIEAGPVSLSPTNDGLGGFPVQVSETSLVPVSSSGSVHSAPLAPVPALANSAPPPTLDDVYNLNSPLPPATSNNALWSVRSSSFNDADSTYSGFSNPPPPPSMPPPPPPGAPPPPPPSSSYGNYYGQPPPLPSPSMQSPPPLASPSMQPPPLPSPSMQHNPYASPPMSSPAHTNPLLTQHAYGATPPPPQPNYNPFG